MTEFDSSDMTWRQDEGLTDDMPSEEVKDAQ